MSVLSHLDALERALAARGFPAMSSWWRETLARFYKSSCRQYVLRVGRRGGKSSTLCRIAVLVALFGDHVIPPGDVGVVAIISVSRDEAAQRLRTIRAILDALHVKHRPIEGGIELEGRSVVFKTFAASIAGVAGFTCICAICDEVAKWRDADSGSNPASEVLASLRPTMATQPNARIFLSSSPLSTLDAHCESFEVGDNAFQLTAYAPTWIAHPALTEAATHALEPDARRWAREYQAVPSSAVNAALDAAAIDRAFAIRLDGFKKAERVLVIDVSSGKNDSFSWAVAGWNRNERGRYQVRADGSLRRWPWGDPVEIEGWKPTSPPVLSFDLVDGVDGRFWDQVPGDEIVRRLVALCKTHKIRSVHSDQRESMMMRSAFEKAGLLFFEHVYTSQSKPVAVEIVRRWLREGQLALPIKGKGERLKRELLAFEERLTANGQMTFRGRGTAHDDYAILTLTAALAESDPGLPMSPHHRPVPRGRGLMSDIGLM